MVINKFLYGAMTLFLSGCVPSIVYVADPEYPHDEQGASAWQSQLRSELNGAKIKLRRHTQLPPAGWRPIVTFIHTADAQIRDVNILYRSRGTSKIVDLFSSGTERVRELDTRDEYPLVALVGAVNSESNRPAFLIHAGDSAEASTRGEVLRFVSIMNLLDIPWYGAVGNHDILLFGNFAQTFDKKNAPPETAFIDSRSTLMSLYKDAGFRIPSTSLYGRHLPTIKSDFVGPQSHAHGFDLGRTRPLSSDYTLRVKSDPPLRIITIDTNVPDTQIPTVAQRQFPAVGAGATIMDEDTFKWLQGEIRSAQEEGEAVLIAGHHPLSRNKTAKFEYAVGGARRPLLDFLMKERNVVAYLGGHTHRSQITLHDGERGVGRGLAEIIAPSLHVFPQVALEITIFERAGELAMLVTPVQGEIIKGTAPTLENKVRQACLGAIKEERRVNGISGDAPEDCWPAQKDMAKYYGFVLVGDVPDPLPAASLTLTDGRTSADVCRGSSVTIRASLRGAPPWDLLWTDGVTQRPDRVDTSPAEFTFTAESTREYTLAAIGDKNESDGKLPDEPIRITVRELPSVSVSGPNRVCAGEVVTINASGADEYLWSTGDTTPSITLKIEGDTSIRVTGTRSGCSHTVQHQIGVFNVDPAQVIGPPSVCKGSKATLTASPGAKYSWVGPGVTGATSQSVTVNSVSGSVFTVVVTDANGCATTATTELNEVAPIPIEIIGPDEICAGDELRLTTSSPLRNYYWSTGDLSETTSRRPTDTTTYQLTGIDANGCPAHASKIVRVIPAAMAITTGGGSICEGEAQRISVALTGTPPWDLEWSDGHVSHIGSPMIERAVSVEGRYEIKRVQDSHKCGGVASGSAMVTILPRPKVTISGPKQICATETATLVVSGGHRYEWSTGETTEQIIVVPEETETYTATAFTENGCFAVASHTLEVSAICD